MPSPKPVQPGTRRIVQGHPTYTEPDLNKEGQDGAPKPEDGTTRDGGVSLPQRTGKGPDLKP